MSSNTRKIANATIHFILYIFSLFILISCLKDADDIIEPAFEKKLVVHCFISPSDTLLYAKVDYNKPVYGLIDNTKSDLMGVKILISDDLTEKQFIARGDTFVLDTKQFPIAFNKTYSLKVSDTNGNQATTFCTIPPNQKYEISLDTSLTESFIDEWGYSYQSLTCKIKINNVSSQKAYYRVILYQDGYYPSYSDPSILEHYSYKITEFYYYNNSGKTSMAFEYINQYYNIDKIKETVSYKIKVIRYSDEYYQFKKSLDNYSNGETYFREPSAIYSNIQGGFGLFCGYTVQEYLFNLK